MRGRVFLIGLGLAVALAGCSSRKQYTDKTDLARDYVAALQSGDKGKILAITYTQGLSPENLQLNNQYAQDISSMSTWPGVSGQEIKKIEESSPDAANEKLRPYQGRPLCFAIKPKTIITVYLADSTMGGKTVCPVPVFEREGRFWVCPIAYKTEADYLKEDATVKNPETPPISYPDSVELSKTKEVSIVRLPVTDPRDSGISTEYAKDRNLIGAVHADCTMLSRAFVFLDPDDDWYDGLDMLPDGFFRIEVKNLPKDQKTIYQNIVEAFQASFNLKITRENHVWDGYEIVVPEKLPTDFTKSAKDSSGNSGDSFKGYTMPDLADWLEDKINLPVEITQDFGGQRFDFDIPMWDEDDKEIKGLEYMDFKVEPKKLTRMTVLITKNPGK